MLTAPVTLVMRTGQGLMTLAGKEDGLILGTTKYTQEGADGA